MEFCRQVYQAILDHDLIRPGDRVLAAVSGGADSVCLLLVLDQIRRERIEAGKDSFELGLVTVDHGIRGENSAGDADFASQLGRSLGLTCFVYREDVPVFSRQNRLSEEEAARTVRYRCFARAAHDWQADAVAVAHNRDDQAETVLLNLLRGSGLTGLSGLAWSRTLERGSRTSGQAEGEIRVIRPLLDVSREEIEAWLSQKGQTYRTDETNLEDHHTRNRLRHHVIPMMEEEINGNAKAHIAAAAADLARAAAFVEETAARWLETFGRVSREDGYDRIMIPARELGEFNQLAAGQVILQALKAVSPAGSVKDIGRVHIQAVLGLAGSRSGARLPLPGNLSVRREYDMLVFEPDLAGRKEKKKRQQNQTQVQNQDQKQNQSQNRNEDQGFSVCVDMDILSEEPLIIQAPDERLVSLRISYYNKEKNTADDCTNCMDYDKIKNGLTLRTPMKGDYFQLEGGGKKKVKNYLADQKIPVHERNRVLVLADDSHVIWIMQRDDRRVQASSRLPSSGRLPGRVTAAYKVTPSTSRVLELRILPAERADT